MADIYDEQDAVSQDEVFLFSVFWSLVSGLWFRSLLIDYSVVLKYKCNRPSTEHVWFVDDRWTSFPRRFHWR